jgi:hypothetical protein
MIVAELAELGLTLANGRGYPASQVALQIPKAYRAAIAKLCKLPDAAAEELAKALEAGPIARDPKQATERAATTVHSIPVDDLRPIVDAVYALYRVREFADSTPETFLADLVESIRTSSPPDPALRPEEVNRVRERFQRLLSIDRLSALSKAYRLQREGERIYCEATILSDIRPVFGSEVSATPHGAVVTHTLKLDYHGGRDHKEFFIVMDGEDLKALRSVIDRAQIKDTTLRNLMKDTNLEDLGT